MPSGKVKEVAPITWGVHIDHFGHADDLEKTMSSVLRECATKQPAISISTPFHGNVPNYAEHNVERYEHTSDDTTAAILNRLDKSGVSYLLSLRSGIELNTGCLSALEAALAGKADAVVPAVKINDIGKTIPVLPGCISVAFLQPEFDVGAIAIDLTSESVRAVANRLSSDRPHFGIRDELVSVKGNIWPYPGSLASYESAKQLSFPYNANPRLHTAFAKAANSDIYHALAVAKHHYQGIEYANTFEREGL